MQQIKQAFIQTITREVKDDQNTDEFLKIVLERNWSEEFNSDDEEEKIESEVDKQITKSVTSLISTDVIINNYNELLKSDYTTRINSIRLQYRFNNRIKFELEEGKLLCCVLNLNKCLIGDIEIEMEVPDGVRIYLEFVNMKMFGITYGSNTIHLTFKDNKAKSNSRMLDDTINKHTNRTERAFNTIRDAFVNVSETLQKSNLMETDDVLAMIWELQDILRKKIDKHQPRLEIRILDANMIPLNHTLHANFKCRYRDLPTPEIQTLRKLRKNHRYDKINAEIVKKVESLY
jgi:hypothetical protein